MVPERIEREVLIEAPVEVVWAVVTEREHIAGWLSDAAEIDLRPGGPAVFTWEGHGSAYARVERVEPPHLVAFRWAPTGRERPAGGVVADDESTLVELRLTAEGDRTRLHVVESGFPRLAGSEEENARYAESHRAGWERELGELCGYVAYLHRAARR